MQVRSHGDRFGEDEDGLVGQCLVAHVMREGVDLDAREDSNVFLAVLSVGMVSMELCLVILISLDVGPRLVDVEACFELVFDRAVQVDAGFVGLRLLDRHVPEACAVKSQNGRQMCLT